MKKYTPSRVPKPRWVNYNKSLISQGTSKEELEVYTFLRLEFSDIPIYRSDRVVLNGRELDIYIPSRNLAVEYNGLYFHNSSSKTPNYHLHKTSQCEKKGIRLISLFSDEWENKKPLCIDLLRKALGRYTPIRNFDIRELDFEESRKFFESTHLNGYDPSTSISIGCFLEGRILSAIGITKVVDKWYITRHSETFGVKTINGMEEMCGYLADEYGISEIGLILDRRLFDFREYLQEGFTMTESTEPHFQYTKDFKSRFYSEELDRLEESVLKENGFLKVYDCGNVIFNKSIN